MSSNPTPTSEAQFTRDRVREGYAAIATGAASLVAANPNGASASGCCGGSSCATSDTAEAAEALARAVGYTAEELSNLPDGANMGLSCGNPVALASLRPGEVVLDLGAGGGFDVFIAGRKVGPTGRAIGVDMTPEMLAKARRNITHYRQASGLENVEFRLGEIEALPVADASVDVVISNCVLNLCPDKSRAWREIARVLKPNGRVAVSDLALLRPLPPTVRNMVEALVGCIAGAVLLGDTERHAREAGLSDIRIVSQPGYVEAMTTWQDPLYQRILAELPQGTKPSDYITSAQIEARRPTAEEVAARAKAEAVSCCGPSCCG